MSLTNYGEAALLDHVYGGPALPQPTLYVGLFTTATGEDGSGTEVTGPGYARVQVTWGPVAAGPGDSQQKSNSSIAVFPQATGAWGNCTHFGTFDAPSGGNMWNQNALQTARDIQAGDTPEFGVGSLIVTMD